MITKTVITKITPTFKAFSTDVFKEFWQYREMLILMAWRDVKVRYTQSALGIGWSVFPALSQMAIYTLVFGNLVRLDSDGAPYPLFALTAVIPWVYFSQSLNAVSSSVYGAGSLIQKVYFPRLILPFVALFEKGFDFLVALCLLLVITFFFGGQINKNILYLPILILILMTTALGYGMLVAAMLVHFRDFLHLMGYVTIALMYSSPVVYPVSYVPEHYRNYYALNPMVGVIEGFRSALLSTKPMPWDLIFIGALVSFVGIILGFWYFRLNENKFADVI